MSSDVHSLSGAYALNALGPEEAVEFRRHLDECPTCREEVQALQRAAARMGAAEAVSPPPHLKRRILAAAARTPQQASRPTPVAAAEPPMRSPRPWRRTPKQLRRLAATAATLIVAGAAAFGVIALIDQEDPSLSEAVVQVFEADDARTTMVETTNGGRLVVGVSPSRGEMAVDTRALPDPGEGRVYQLWAIRGENIGSAAVLEDVDDGVALGVPMEGTTIALTVEPSGGSRQPTSNPIVQVDPLDI
jgi:anti-sigma-K factor RskA